MHAANMSELKFGKLYCLKRRCGSLYNTGLSDFGVYKDRINDDGREVDQINLEDCFVLLNTIVSEEAPCIPNIKIVTKNGVIGWTAFSPRYFELVPFEEASNQ